MTGDGRRWQDILGQATAYGHRELPKTPDPAGDPRETYYGYERIISHLEAADRPASAQYLYLLTDDMITAEATDPQKWRHAAYGEPGEILSVDLLDRQLGMIAHNNPHAATLVMTDHFDYLMLQGEDDAKARPGPEYPLNPSNPERHGLTDALVAATTGRTPDADHEEARGAPTEVQRDIAVKVFDYYEARSHLLDDKGPHNYRTTQLGIISAEHIELVFDSYVLMESDQLDGREIRDDLPSTRRLIEQLAKDPEAAAAIEGAGTGETARRIDAALNRPREEGLDMESAISRAVAPGAKIADTIIGSQAEVAYDKALNEGSRKTRQKWTERALNMISDGATNGLPMGGTAAAKILDDLNADLYSKEKKQHEVDAGNDRNEIIRNGRRHTESSAIAALEIALAENDIDSKSQPAQAYRDRVRLTIDDQFRNETSKS
ncbi:hypothetical protein [Streptomyces spiramenti]|uniref:Uncharacterized protein n=1 Tax=Streptomyces spiramenti TaxID=2720606 RepID=A0ABX1AU07_9ACTN|nr:hypothetical protein [Streptomyces spiramenti]NJP67892.1 hypothetical protein [Streptomyces spiramenti]